MKINDVNIGDAIKAILENKKISQANLAKNIGLKPQNVKRDIIEKKSLDTGMLRKISEFLDCNLFELYTSYNQNDYSRGEVKATVKIEMGQQQQEKTFTFLFGDNKVEIK